MEQKDTMYSCNICGKVFRLDTMYACYHGHYLCTKCYKQVYYRGKEQKCPHGTCNAFIVRNGEVNKAEPIEKSKIMFPNPCMYSQNSLMNPNCSLVSLTTLCRPSMISMNPSSKKPIQCPHHGCNKTIAVSSLDSHFEHDHKHVALIETNVEARNGLDFYFKDLYGQVRTLCLVLINIDDPDNKSEINCFVPPKASKASATTPGTVSEISKDEIDPQRSISAKASSILQAPRPFFIVMAAKVTAGDFVGAGDEDEDEEDPPDVGFTPIDKIIFFVTSNVITSYSYTIAVSTPDQGIRLKYYGPLLSMNEDYKKLCTEGKGLILNHNHVEGMSDSGNRGVCLDVIIHERGEENYDSDE